MLIPLAGGERFQLLIIINHYHYIHSTVMAAKKRERETRRCLNSVPGYGHL
jgi:hypothetical protein